MCWYMIYLLRHGEIEDPTIRRFIGQTDCALSKRGHAQADYWKKWMQGKRISSIFCSDLIRSSETAKIISRGLNVAVSIRPELKEIHLGEWDGQAMQAIRSDFPAEWEERGKLLDTFRPPRGESFTDLYQRVIPAFDHIAETASDPVLIVAHAGVNRMILCRVLGMPIRKLFSIRQNYGALNLIDYSKDEYEVIAVNYDPFGLKKVNFK